MFGIIIQWNHPGLEICCGGVLKLLSQFCYNAIQFIYLILDEVVWWGFPGGASGKEPACQCRRLKRCGFHPWVGKILWRRAGQPTPVFLPEESHGQRSLVGYSPWGHKELDRTEQLSMHACKALFTYLSLQLLLFIIRVSAPISSLWR